MNQTRCKWCNLKNPIYVEYHDKEWGVPVHDDKTLLEFLILEPFQAGLSWETILNKREDFRRVFEDYDIEKICSFDETKILEMLSDASIVRNRRKIEAAINNTKIFVETQNEWGSFSDYIWHFTEGKTIYECDKTSSPLSDAIAKDMKQRGMKFIGTTTVYSFLQAIGVIYSHEKECFLYKSDSCMEEKKAFIYSLDFMKLGQAINRGQWQSAAMIIQRMDRTAKKVGLNDFERQFAGIRQCINRRNANEAKQILATVIGKRVKIMEQLKEK